MKKIYIILIVTIIAWATFVTFTLTAGMSIFAGAAACVILYLSIKDSPTGKDKTFRGDVSDEFKKNKEKLSKKKEDLIDKLRGVEVVEVVEDEDVYGSGFL